MRRVHRPPRSQRESRPLIQQPTSSDPSPAPSAKYDSQLAAADSPPRLNPDSLNLRLALRFFLPPGTTQVPEEIVASLPQCLRAQARRPHWFGLDCTRDEIEAAAESADAPAFQKQVEAYRRAKKSATTAKLRLLGKGCSAFQPPPGATDTEDFWKWLDESMSSVLKVLGVAGLDCYKSNGWLAARCLHAIEKEDWAFFQRFGRALGSAPSSSGRLNVDNIDAYLCRNWLRKPEGAALPLWKLTDPELTKHVNIAFSRKGNSELMVNAVSRRRHRLGLRSIHS